MSIPADDEQVHAIQKQTAELKRDMEAAMFQAKPQQRQHVSDAAWEAYAKDGHSLYERNRLDDWNAKRGLVLLTVAEHDELLLRAGECDGADALYRAEKAMHADTENERDALRAEVERWRQQADYFRDCYSAARKEVLDGMIEIERLRKGVMPNETGSSPGTARVNAVAGVASAKTREQVESLREQLKGSPPAGPQWPFGGLLRTPALDPRLGIPQPDGEPVAPMSGRKAYRWGMV